MNVTAHALWVMFAFTAERPQINTNSGRQPADVCSTETDRQREARGEDGRKREMRRRRERKRRGSEWMTQSVRKAVGKTKTSNTIMEKAQRGMKIEVVINQCEDVTNAGSPQVEPIPSEH